MDEQNMPSKTSLPPSEFGFIGHSQSLIDAISCMKKFSRAQAPILICGETGTGKELAARAVHYMSPRHMGPFIPVNCASYQDTLFESSFFGHERGAFTGANERHHGLVSQADGGTLFLDEIDSLTAKAQAVLLRFLQERTFRPVGSEKERRCDISIIAASNADLEQLSQDGDFRSDLYYRLNVARIDLPPLRSRHQDTIILANHFIKKFSAMYKSGPTTLHPDSGAELMNHDWPGNVRELENLIHREYLRCDSTETELRIPPLSGTAATSRWETLTDPTKMDFKSAKEAVLSEFEKNYATTALAITGGNVSHAARMVGKERRAFGKILKKHRIQYKNETYPRNSNAYR